MNNKLGYKSKTRSIISYIKSNNDRGKKINKNSPKTIEYNKIAEKYGKLLETSLNTSENTHSNRIKNEKGINDKNNDSYYDFIIDNIYNDNIGDNNKTYKYKYNTTKDSYVNNNNNNKIYNDSMYYFTLKQKLNDLSNMDNSKNRNEKMNNMKYKKNASLSIISHKNEIGQKYKVKDNNYCKYMYNTFSNQLKKNKIRKINGNVSEDKAMIDKLINNIKNKQNNKSCNNIRAELNKEKVKEKKKDYKCKG